MILGLFCQIKGKHHDKIKIESDYFFIAQMHFCLVTLLCYIININMEYQIFEEIV